MCPHQTATNPLERIKMLSQTGEHGIATTNASILNLYRNIIAKEGVLGLWAGNGANLLRVFPAKAVVFSSNDFYKLQLKKLFHVDGPSLPGHLAFLAGGLSGMSACAFTYPLDFARGRISGKLAQHKNHKQYRGIVGTLALTIKDEGLFAVYKGMTPTLLGAMPYEGIKFGTVGVLELIFPSSETTPLRKMFMGGLGGVMAGLITYPNDTVRRLLQIQGSRGTTTQFTGYW
jgi:solute carrier family 25 (mitochondrial phosphate transporter), member 23/24/25/41